jgi:VWFA-related protein
LLALVVLFAVTPLSVAQTPQQTPPPQNGGQSGNDNTPAASGGPEGDVGPIATPKKKDDAAHEEKKPEKFKNPAGMPDYSLHVDVPSVDVDVLVTTKDGIFVPNLKPENFRVLEDGVPQKVTSFNTTDAPITCVMLVEFANTNYYFINDMLQGSYTFAQTLKPQDWIALISYDMKPQIWQDFTQDKAQLYANLGHLRIPGFSETNLFDALYDTLDRMQRVQGHKYILLIASGVDTFSKHTLDDAYKKVKATPDVTIYAVSTGGFLRTAAEPSMSQVSQLTYLQADNQMRTFATLTGGMYFQPRFAGQWPEVFRDIGSAIRTQYILTYHPTNTKMDGSYRKIKVQLINPATGDALKMINEKGKDVKYQIIARDGYNAKHSVE